MSDEISRIDEGHLRRCVELATQALENGDDPFGSVLVDADGATLAEALNREQTDRDPTAHPELALVRWAIAHLTPDQRATTTVYTSGEHCPMCSARPRMVGTRTRRRCRVGCSACRVAGVVGSAGRPGEPDAAHSHRAESRRDRARGAVRRPDARRAPAGACANEGIGPRTPPPRRTAEHKGQAHSAVCAARWSDDKRTRHLREPRR